jgi:hypothetical protein
MFWGGKAYPDMINLDDLQFNSLYVSSYLHTANIVAVMQTYMLDLASTHFD